MNIGDFLAGVLLGTGLTLAAAWHHHGVMVDELKAGQKAELVNLHYSYQENLKRAWEYAVEPFGRNAQNCLREIWYWKQ